MMGPRTYMDLYHFQLCDALDLLIRQGENESMAKDYYYHSRTYHGTLSTCPASLNYTV